MKPNKQLVLAWHTYLKQQEVAVIARLKAALMFKASDNDTELYVRADVLMRQSTQAIHKAEVAFRKALKVEYTKRFRIEWKDWHTCTVWVHAPYSKEETGLRFNKSLRKIT